MFGPQTVHKRARFLGDRIRVAQEAGGEAPERGSLMPIAFRNVDASPTDDIRTWPYEALVTVIDRGLVADWQPIFAELRRAPWGPVSRRVERYLSYRQPDGVGTLFGLAVERARADADRADRDEVAARLRARWLVQASPTSRSLPTSEPVLRD